MEVQGVNLVIGAMIRRIRSGSYSWVQFENEENLFPLAAHNCQKDRRTFQCLKHLQE